MDGKVATPASLRGNVRTIPEIDKTLTVEGQCADAKVTGDALAEHKDTLESHAATLNEHKDSIGNSADRVTAVEGALTTLTDNFNTASGFIANLNDVVLNDHTPKLATLEERADKLEQDVEEHLMAFDIGIKPKVDGLDVKKRYFTVCNDKINGFSDGCKLAKSLHLCTVKANFQTTGNFFERERIFSGLPKPALDNLIIAGYMGGSDIHYLFTLRQEGNEGVIYTESSEIPEFSPIDIAFTYVTAADSAV